jgi:pSer/pThr/pTyr-binding forkhead associated (FHA) protein
MVANQMEPVGPRRERLFLLLVGLALRTVVRIGLLACALVVLSSTGQAYDDGFDWDQEFPYPVYVIHITKTYDWQYGRPADQNRWVDQDRYILYVSPPKDGKLDTPDDYGGWIHHEAELIGGPYTTPRQVCDRVKGTPAMSLDMYHVPQLPSFDCRDLYKTDDCQDYCRKRFDKEGVDNAILHPESSTGKPPNCDCWCEVESVGLTTDCFQQTRDCYEVCRKQYGAHATWDGEDAEHCVQCICELGWKLKNEKCISCQDICKDNDSRAQYDKENSREEFCACKCDEQKLLQYDDEIAKCECLGHAEPKGDRCICKAGWERSLQGGCKQCPRHAHSEAGKACEPDPGYKWMDDRHEECVCDESAGYFWNADRSECLQVLGVNEGYDKTQKLIDEMTAKGGPGYTFQPLKPGTKFSSTSYPPGTIVLWDLGSTPLRHSSMIIDSDGLQIEMGREARTFVTTPSPIQDGEYTPAAVLVPPHGTRIKLAKMLKLLGISRYDGNDWNCHGFMRSIKRYVAIPDPGARLPSSASTAPGTSRTIMKDPPGIPLTLELQQGALYGGDLAVDAFLPDGFVELTGEFLVEVDEDGSSQIQVIGGEATYYADGDSGGVHIGASQLVAVRGGRPSEPTGFESASLQPWWVESPETQRSSPSASQVGTVFVGLLVIAGVGVALIATWQVVRRRRLALVRVPAPGAGARSRDRRSVPRPVTPSSNVWGTLAVIQGGAASKTLNLSRPILAIGRSASSDLVLRDSLISRQHAEIRWQNGGAVLSDLASANGTFVNGKRISGSYPLRPGDVIRLGQTKLVFGPSSGTRRMASEPDRSPMVDDQPARVSLVLDRPVLTIGRGSTSDLVLVDNKVSRRHAQIRRIDGKAVIYDLGSSNGTYVNGERVVDPRPLKPGDIIHVGQTELVFGPSGLSRRREGAAGQLIAIQGKSKPSTLALGRRSKVLIGRSRENDIVIRGDERVSRRHAEIRWAGSAHEIRDLDSGSGVSVNGRRVDRVRLSPGDRIRLGNTVFVYKD